MNELTVLMHLLSKKTNKSQMTNSNKGKFVRLSIHSPTDSQLVREKSKNLIYTYFLLHSQDIFN